MYGLISRTRSSTRYSLHKLATRYINSLLATRYINSLLATRYSLHKTRYLHIFCFPSNLVSVSCLFRNFSASESNFSQLLQVLKGPYFPFCRKDFNKCLRHSLPKLKMQGQNAYVRPFHFDGQCCSSVTQQVSPGPHI